MTGRSDILAKIAIAVTALILVSCGTKPTGPDEDPWERLSGDMPIRFSADLTGPATRTVSSLPAGSFGVFAFYQPGTIGGAAGAWGDGSGWTPNFMFNQRVDFDGSSDYSYSPLRYWPSNIENTITFWAYYPFNDPGISRFRVVNSSTTYSDAACNIPNIEYSTGGHTDFLVSGVVTDQVYGDTNVSPTYPNIVKFTFSHAMSWVDFRVQKQDPDDTFEMVLKTLRIDGIYSSGIYNQDLGWIATTGTTGSITVYTHDPSDPLVLYHPDPSDPSTDPVQLPKTGEDEIMPLPQLLKMKSASLYVEYALKLSGAPGEGTTYVSQVPLGNIHDEWERNKHYTYHVIINPGNPILFTAEVVPWAAEQTAYYTFE